MFQSRLTTPGGQPLAGEFSFSFFIYDVPVGGVPVWTETHDGTALPRIRVVNGLLSTVLGQGVPLDAAVFDPGGSGDRYVAVELAGEELCRVKLTATAYALSATVANGLWNPVTSTSLDAQALDDRYVDSAEVEAFVPPATTDVAGKVILAAHDATTAGAAVQGSDPRLAGIRVSVDGGTPVDRRAQVNVIAGPNLTVSAVDDPANDKVDVTVATQGLTLGADVQGYDPQLTDVAGLAPADNHVVIGNGSNFVAEDPATARASLGLEIGSNVQGFSQQLADLAGLTYPGNAGNVVAVNAGETGLELVARTSGGVTNVVLRVFDSAGTHTYNPTPNMAHCQVICTGVVSRSMWEMVLR